ncbi:unnamed protein product [Symbiodinium sp. CCMP2456]|nr:unnamed protein product [Symbiodinium sp. CCMP2456]
MATKEAVFDELASRFKLEGQVKEQILKVGITTLSHFRCFVKDDDELLAMFFTPVAWNAVRQAEQQREGNGTHVSVSLDEEASPSDQWITKDYADMATGCRTYLTQLSPCRHSHFSHSTPVTCWENSFQVGRGGAPEQTVYAYSQWLFRSPVASRVPELCNKKLACDCGLADACHGDVLVAAFALPERKIKFAFASGCYPTSVVYPISQASIIATVHNIALGPGVARVRWPYLEDLVNSPVLQALYIGSSLKRHQLRCPLDWDAVVESDINLKMAEGLSTFSYIREDAMAFLRELARRLQDTSDQLRELQHPEVRKVNPKVHLALFAVLVASMSWPDTSFCRGLMQGFPAVGQELLSLRTPFRLIRRFVITQSSGLNLESWPDSVSWFGEDRPHAYRKIPMRLLFLPLSCYFDDVTRQDVSSIAQRSQEQVEELFRMFGYPFAEAKRQLPQTSGDFLGRIHDLSQLQTKGHIKVWVRQRLVDKVQDMIGNARATGLLRPGTASQLFGRLAFLDYGAFGRIARAGLNPLKDRQYAKNESRLTAELEMAFDTIEAALALHPSREVPVLPSTAFELWQRVTQPRKGTEKVQVGSPEVFCLSDQDET